MLSPIFSVEQTNCDELIFKDITPPYSTKYKGGYGAPNVAASAIVWSTLTMDFGNNLVVEIGSDYNQTKAPWVIKAMNIPVPASEVVPVCGTCGPSVSVTMDSAGHMVTFPSGCITIKYEVFSYLAGAPYNRKLEGTKVAKIIVKCHELKKLVDIANKLTLPGSNCIPQFKNDDERIEVLMNLNLAWMKLEASEAAVGCDCDCVAARIKQVNTYLDSIEI